MCTLAIAWRAVSDAAVVAAANRDEAVDRPSSPPAYRDWTPRVVCPLDDRAGGTWIGVNERGLFAAVTNRRADVAGDRSRGLLVRDALGADSAAAAHDLVEAELARRQYAGFNLLLADASEATVLEWDGVLDVRALDPGIHVVVNEGLDGDAPKAARIRGALAPSGGASSAAAWRELAGETLRSHDLGACVHGEGFGTRSSSLITVAGDAASSAPTRADDAPASVDYAFADGPPCEVDYRPVEGHF